MRRPWDPPAVLALSAIVLMLGGWALLGIRLEGYRFISHPFALPGARGLPDAVAFNTLVFMLPGGLMAVLANGLRQSLPEPASWLHRIGCALALLSALAWAGQGVLPLELTQLDGTDSRWHAVAWTLWWIAVASAAVLMALAVPGMRRSGAALLVALLLPMALPSGTWMTVLAQPLAVLLWGVWMWSGVKTFRRPEATCSH